MSRPIVTVSGLPGSGTTTLCRLLEKRLGLPYVYAGALFREEAERRGLTLAEFGALCQDDPRADRTLDERQKDLLRDAADSGKGLLLEGRLAGWHAQREEILAVRVWLACDTEIRLQRILERDGGDLSTQIQVTSERERSEKLRYRRFYGIDLDDMSPYDLVLDSSDRDPDELANKVEALTAQR